MIRTIIISSLVITSTAWAPQHCIIGRSSTLLFRPSCTNSHLTMLVSGDTITSLLAGSIAGALGVGVAYPLDTIKTKQQLNVESNFVYSNSPSSKVVSTVAVVSLPELGLFSTIADIWKSSGFEGFYGGVQTSMIGQAVTKATAFSVNTAALEAHYDLVYAAAVAGLVTAFLAVPVDRIKVLMQTNSFKTEFDCYRSIMDTEGLKGLLFTGLVPTLFREVPAYTIYFFLYDALMPFATETLGFVAPAVSGAIAGAVCVIPVHPVDVVKTNVQHSATDWQDVVANIYECHGFEGFWEGLLPRMGRAAINHSVTFTVYDFLMHQK